MQQPRPGERWRHRSGWTVYVTACRCREEIRLINPEFYCEVRFIYESTGHYSDMPLPWFLEVYRKFQGAVRNHEDFAARFRTTLPTEDVRYGNK